MSKKTNKAKRNALREQQRNQWREEAERVAAAMVYEDLAPEWGKLMGQGTMKYNSREYIMACALEDELHRRGYRSPGYKHPVAMVCAS